MVIMMMTAMVATDWFIERNHVTTIMVTRDIFMEHIHDEAMMRAWLLEHIHGNNYDGGHQFIVLFHGDGLVYKLLNIII
jgi:hypothetical protein